MKRNLFDEDPYYSREDDIKYRLWPAIEAMYTRKLYYNNRMAMCKFYAAGIGFLLVAIGLAVFIIYRRKNRL